MQVKDRQSGEVFQINAKSIIFAGGPYADGLRALEDKNATKIVTGASGTHIVVPNYYCSPTMGLAVSDLYTDYS